MTPCPMRTSTVWSAKMTGFSTFSGAFGIQVSAIVPAPP